MMILLHVQDKKCLLFCKILYTKKAYLQIEMAAVGDAGREFVKSTYKLEGDGPLVLDC